MILTAERIMHSRLYGSGRHITAIRVHALFADHTIKTPNLISERPPRGDLFTLIESTTEPFPSAEGRLPESLHFAESDVILGVVRARSVHKIGYGRNWDWAAA